MEFKEQKLSNTVVGYLLYFKLLNGFEKFFYMTKDEMETHAKRYSQMYKQGKGFWKTDFDSMGLKTVIKLGLSKFGILSIDMQKAIKSDEGIIDIETGEIKAFPDAPQEEVKAAENTSSKLAQVVEVVAEEVKAVDKTKEKLWKDKFMAASTINELSKIFKEIPENEQSPEIQNAYLAQCRVLSNIKK